MFEDRIKAASFLSGISHKKRCEKVAVIVITHLVPGREVFIQAVADIARIAAIIPKPNSIDNQTLIDLQRRYPVIQLTRRECANTKSMVAKLDELVQPDEKLVILDMGGYFAETIIALKQGLQSNLIGVVEDTENGHQRYAKVVGLPCPIVSVARSDLKEPEDFLVGQSIVFSAEALLRECEVIFVGKTILIIGYGKVGRSIAETLGRRNLMAHVYDSNPIRQVQALAHGHSLRHLESVLASADIIFCATGNMALKRDDYPKLKAGCFIASVTSADDELDVPGLLATYTYHLESPHVQRYEANGHHFYLLNNGNAINFAHHAVVGPYLYIIQAELLKSLQVLSQGGLPHHMVSLQLQEKALIANTWLQIYNGGS